MSSVKVIISSLLFCASSYAQVALQPGDSISASQLHVGDIVTCGYVASAPPPPPPQCQLDSVESSISDTRSRISRMQSGKCAYSVNRCSDNLEDHAVSDSQSALYSDLSDIRSALEDQCRNIGCDQSAIRQAARDYDDVVNFARGAKMTYKEDSTEVRHQAPMLRSDGGLRASCN